MGMRGLASRTTSAAGNAAGTTSTRSLLASSGPWSAVVVAVGACEAPLDDQVTAFDESLLAQLVGERRVELGIPEPES